MESGETGADTERRDRGKDRERETEREFERVRMKKKGMDFMDFMDSRGTGNENISLPTDLHCFPV